MHDFGTFGLSGLPRWTRHRLLLLLALALGASAAFFLLRSPATILDPAWQRLASSSGHAYQALLTYDGRLYEVGGLGGAVSGTRPADFEAYDPRSDSWTQLTPMPNPHIFAGAAVAGDRLYVVGGLELHGTSSAGREETALSSVDVFDFTTGTWSTGPPLAVARSRLAAASLDGAVYAIGGLASSQAVVERLDSDADNWVRVADLQVGRHGHAVVVINGSILVIGGYAGGPGPTVSVEEYDPESDTWRFRADLPTARGFLGAAVVAGWVYAIAGRVTGKPPVERYDPSANRWESLGAMPGPLRNRFGAAALGGAIYVSGGEVQGRGGSSRDLLRFIPP